MSTSRQKYEALLAPPRPVPYEPLIPLTVLDRRKRTHEVTVVERKELGGGRMGERFIVEGSSGTRYIVNIAERPCCSCQDAVTICKHISHIYLNTLRLQPDNPLTWQTFLTPDELHRILPSVPAPIKRLRGPLSPQPGPAPKRARIEPVSSAGMSKADVRLVLVHALEQHPDAEHHLRNARVDILAAVDERQQRRVLEIVGAEYKDIEKMIVERREDNSAQDFSRSIASAKKAMNMLDGLDRAERLDRADEVGKAVSSELERISANVHSHSTGATKIAAVSALTDILEYFYEGAEGLVSKCLRQDLPVNISSRIETVVDFMTATGRQDALNDLETCGKTITRYGDFSLAEIIYNIKGEGKEVVVLDDDEEDEDEHEDEDEDEEAADDGQDEVAADFSAAVAAVQEALKFDFDRMGRRERGRRCEEVSAAAGSQVERITGTINEDSNGPTKIAAVSALLEVMEYICSEVGGELRDYLHDPELGLLPDVGSSVEEVVSLMTLEEKEVALVDIESSGKEMAKYGLETLRSVVEAIKEELAEAAAGGGSDDDDEVQIVSSKITAPSPKRTPAGSPKRGPSNVYSLLNA